MRRNQGFILLETVFEIFIVCLSMLIVLTTFASTVNILKVSLEEMIYQNLISNAAMEIITVSKNEMRNVRTYDSKYVQGDFKEGGQVGLYYDNLTKRIYRFRSQYPSRETLISDKVTSFSYKESFLKVIFDEENVIRLYIKPESSSLPQ